jgi:D-glycero-alpha-D-manno-heptose 1-phosphate guanylyltransferase
VLAGGMGSRLRASVSDRPKPMADVAGTPFLQWQLDSLIDRGVDRFVLATGYMSKYVSAHFGNSYKGCEITYSVEEYPLGTGGAVAKATSRIHNDVCIVTNGDTYCDVPLGVDGLSNFELAMSVVSVNDVERYGSVVLDPRSGAVLQFLPKGERGPGLINAGTYIIRKSRFLARNFEEKFSLESDYLPLVCTEKLIIGVASSVPFIDIGVPEDYVRSQTFIVESARQRTVK